MKALLSLSAALLVAAAHYAMAADADPVLAQNGTETVRQSELELELERLPPDSVDAFLANRTRVGEILTQILLRKTLANQAKAAKLDEQAENAARLRAESQRVLAQLRMAAVEKAAAREFDEKLADHRQRARELYVVEREKYRSPEEISASHILFDTKRHSSEEARSLAERARARVATGADFAAVAREVSEDPSAAKNGGALGWFRRDAMDPRFAGAAFALKEIGALSEPVESQFGWHVIRLDGRRESTIQPFESVRDQIVAELRARYVSQQRDAVIAGIRNDPKTSLNEPVLEQMVMKARAAPSQPRVQR